MSHRTNPFNLRRPSDVSTTSDEVPPALSPAPKKSLFTRLASKVVGPVDADEILASDSVKNPFFRWPLLGPLIVPNETSDARDHCANERTFLAYIKLSMYTTIVSLSIILSFHLKSTPTPLEIRLSTPLGLIFWVLSVAVLFVGLANYINTMNKYSKRMALVQSGWRTQGVIGVLAACIMGTCVILLVIGKVEENAGGQEESGLLGLVVRMADAYRYKDDVEYEEGYLVW